MVKTSFMVMSVCALSLTLNSIVEAAPPFPPNQKEIYRTAKRARGARHVGTLPPRALFPALSVPRQEDRYHAAKQGTRQMKAKKPLPKIKLFEEELEALRKPLGSPAGQPDLSPTE